MELRTKIQSEFIDILLKNNCVGLIAGGMGIGKSYCAIEIIKRKNYKNILITGYRTPLKENWRKELSKWQIYKWEEYGADETEYDIQCGPRINITIQNIQTAYKWSKEYLQQFDLVILDEIHELATEEYGKLIINTAELGIARIGLSGTPDLKNKKEFYDKYCPILMEYYDVEGPITNQVNMIVYEYELSNNYKILTGTKDRKWYVGELQQYEYLTDQYNKAKNLMYAQGADNYFEQALEWMKSNSANKDQKDVGRKFFYATKNRKEFLWNLTSSKFIALEIKNKILNNKISFFNGGTYQKLNKVLIFSELTSQAAKLSAYQYHSKTGKTVKESNILNQEVLRKFNTSEIRELASVNSLTSGVNLVGCNYVIVESFNSSDVKSNQIRGRLRRLGLSDEATLIVIVPKQTQASAWFDNSYGDMEYKVINDINELKI